MRIANKFTFSDDSDEDDVKSLSDEDIIEEDEDDSVEFPIDSELGVRPLDIIYKITKLRDKIDIKTIPLDDTQLLYYKKNHIYIDVVLLNYNAREGYIYSFNDQFIVLVGLLNGNICDYDIIVRDKVYYIQDETAIKKRYEYKKISDNNLKQAIIYSDKCGIFSRLPDELIAEIIGHSDLYLKKPKIGKFNNIMDVFRNIKKNNYNFTLIDGRSELITELFDRAGLLHDIFEFESGWDMDAVIVKNNFTLGENSIDIKTISPNNTTILTNKISCNRDIEYNYTFSNIYVINVDAHNDTFSNHLIDNDIDANGIQIRVNKLEQIGYGARLVVRFNELYDLLYNYIKIEFLGYTDTFLIGRYKENSFEYDIYILLDKIDDICYLDTGSKGTIIKDVNITSGIATIYLEGYTDQTAQYRVNLINKNIIDVNIYNEGLDIVSEPLFLEHSDAIYILMDNVDINIPVSLSLPEEAQLYRYIKKKIKKDYERDLEQYSIESFINKDELFIYNLEISPETNEALIMTNQYMTYTIPIDYTGKFNFSEMYY